MGIGISQPPLEVRHSVTGTRLLDPPDSQLDVNLKRLASDPRIILQPQPSDDPNDPLNWSRVRKELLFASVILATSSVAVIGPLYIPAIVDMSIELGVTVSAMAQANGILVMFLGIVSFLGIVTGRIYGKRPILLLSLILAIAGLAWAANAKTYNSLYGARIVQGLGVGAFACMGNALITDVFYLHEQGTRIAMWQFAWVVSVNVTPLISARVITATSWRTSFYGIMGVACFCFVLYFIVGAETTYVRSDPPVSRSSQVQSIELSRSDKQKDDTEPGPSVLESQATRPKESYRKGWAVWNGRIGDAPVLLSITRPFVIALTPPIFWCMITYAFLFSINIVGGAVFSQIFAAPPYSLDVNTVGLISGVGPLVGGFVACATAGPIADYAARYLSLRNEGYFEPEMYLVLMAPSAVFSLGGLLGWGYSVANASSSIVPAVMIALTHLGLTYGYCGTILYSSAVFPERQGDSFGIIMLVKSCVAFGLLFIVNDWLVTAGPVSFFGTLGGVAFGLSALAILFYIWGKQIRLWTSRSRLLGWTTRA